MILISRTLSSWGRRFNFRCTRQCQDRNPIPNHKMITLEAPREDQLIQGQIPQKDKLCKRSSHISFSEIFRSFFICWNPINYSKIHKMKIVSALMACAWQSIGSENKQIPSKISTIETFPCKIFQDRSNLCLKITRTN